MVQHVLRLEYSQRNGSGGRLKNVRELLILRALKISILYKNHIFQCMGKIFCVEFQRYPLKFHTKISCPYIESCGFYSQVKISELLDLRAHKCVWYAPQYHSCWCLGSFRHQIIISSHWYWLGGIYGSLSSMRMNFNYLRWCWGSKIQHFISFHFPQCWDLRSNKNTNRFFCVSPQQFSM